MKGYGLNLFSLRHAIKTRDDFLATACRLRDMGYSYLQFSGAPFDAALIGEVSRSADIPVVLTHVPLDRILNDTDALMREHETFGCRNIGLSRLDNITVTSRDLCYKTVERLNLVAEKMRAQGFEFFYHNHHTDLFRLGDKTVLDYMIEEAPAISFTLDVYWLQYGGVSILEYINKLKGRIACVHLKDYRGCEMVGGVAKLLLPFASLYELTKYGAYSFSTSMKGFEASDCRVMIVHSEDDDTIPIGYGYEKYYEKYGDDDRFTFKKYTDRGHGVMTDKSGELDIALMGEIADFFDSCVAK